MNGIAGWVWLILVIFIGFGSLLTFAITIVGGGARWERRMKAAIEASEQDS
jgi:hypothetical protein